MRHWLCGCFSLFAAFMLHAGEIGYLSVVSEPAGATVFVDGKEAGRTPLERLPLVPGPHSLDIVSACHEDNYGYNRGREVLIEPNGTVSLSVVLTDRLEKLTLAVQDKEEKPLSGVAVYVDGALRGTAPGAFLLPVCVGAVTLAKDGFADAPIKIDLREPKKLTVKMGTTGKPSPLLSGVVASKRRPEAPKELPAVAIVPTEPLAADRRAVEPAESPSRVSAAETGKIPSAPPSGGFKEFRARFPYFWYGIGIASGGLLTALGGIVCNHFADTKYDEYESLSNEDRILEEMAKPGFDRDVYLARIDRAKSDGDDLVWARNGLYIAGAAIFAGGVVLAFFPALDDEKKKVSFRFAPGYLPGGAGVSFLLSY